MEGKGKRCVRAPLKLDYYQNTSGTYERGRIRIKGIKGGN